MSKLKSNLSSGPDGIPPILVKQLSTALAGPLSLIYTSFMSVGAIPDAWRRAVITPIYKSGPAGDTSKYRPVSLTSVFSKVMERVIAGNLADYLMVIGLINKQQHGFLRKRSTVTNLTETMHDWTLAVENKQSVACAYIDYSKAFDVVSHSKLMVKLASYGISGNLLSWMGNFLAGRSQVTRVGSSLSSAQNVTSGVVQGSCLGPLLFLIYINDITDRLPSSCICKLYADDLKLYTVIDANVDACSTLQSYLDVILEWSATWQLTISHKKCAVMVAGRQHCKGQGDSGVAVNIGVNKIDTANSVKDLGVHVQHDLRFTTHINTIVTKARARANLIHRCFISKDPETLMRAFTTYVRPILEYASVIWSPYRVGEIKQIESVQRTFTKRIAGLASKTYDSRLKLLGLDSLETRRLKQDLLYTYKIVFGAVNVDYADMFNLNNFLPTRGHSYKLFVQRCRLDITKHFLSNRVVSTWNSLPATSEHFRSYRTFVRFINSIDVNCLSNVQHTC
jgi:ribonucleases P/MRP protein subunit RPP40